MPDETKLCTLAAAGFVVRQTCGSCAYFEVQGGGRSAAASRLVWGGCRLTSYAHGKHTYVRPASVRSDGYCPRYAERKTAADDLRVSGYDRFREAP